MMRKITLAVLAFLLAAPAFAIKVPQGAASASIRMPNGSIVDVELALTRQMQARGLMFRDSLPDDKGMLFIFSEGDVKTFWMKNTLIPLDIIFLDADMKVQNIYHRVPASRPGQPELEVAKVSAPAFNVLELASGMARKYGLKPGLTLEVRFIQGVKKKTAPAKSGSGKKK